MPLRRFVVGGKEGPLPVPPSVTSPWRRPRSGWFFVAWMATLLAAFPATSQEVGTASKVVNKVLGKSLGYEIRGDQKIQFREEINTLAKSASTISFKDATALSIGEDSQLTIDEFVYDPAVGTAKGALRVVKGALRLATGIAANKAVTIETQVAVIGIRGTILDVVADRQRTGVLVHQGQVTVQAAGTSLQLDAGQFVLIDASAAQVMGSAPPWFLERTRPMFLMLGLPEKPSATPSVPARPRAPVAPLR